MCRFSKLILPTALMLASSLVLAGGADCHKAEGAANTATNHKKCSMSGEDCKKMMEEARSRGWIGIELDENEKGAMVVSKVYPSTPAETAGFKVGDVLLAMNGISMTEENADKLKTARKKLGPGDSITYNVRRGDRDQNLTGVLARMPDDVYTAMVSEHMKEHTDIAAAK